MSNNITIPRESLNKLLEVIGLYSDLSKEAFSYKIDPEPIMDKIEILLHESADMIKELHK